MIVTLVMVVAVSTLLSITCITLNLMHVTLGMVVAVSTLLAITCVTFDACDTRHSSGCLYLIVYNLCNL